MNKRFFFYLELYAPTFKVTFWFRDYDFYVELPEYSTFLNIYKRKYLDDLLKFLDSKDYEPILFSCGLQPYVDKVMVTHIFR